GAVRPQHALQGGEHRDGQGGGRAAHVPRGDAGNRRSKEQAMMSNLGDRMDGGGAANVWLPGRAAAWNGAVELPGRGETRAVVGRRCGFSVAVPGRPELLATDLVPRPVRHAALRLGDASIEVGLRLDELPTEMAPASLLPALVVSYAHAEGAKGRVTAA